MSATIFSKQYALLDKYSKLISDTNSIESDYAKCAAEYILRTSDIQSYFILNILNRANTYIARELSLIISDIPPGSNLIVPNDSSPASFVSTSTNDMGNINDFVENFVDCSDNNEVLNVFCEGTSTNIGTSSACSGCGIYAKYIGYDNEVKEIHKKYILSNDEPSSNQRAELSTLYAALETLDKIKKDNSNLTSFNIHITSKYAYTCVTDWGKAWSSKKWKRAEGPIKNVDIIRPLYEKLQHMSYVKLSLLQKDKSKKITNIPEGFIMARDLAVRAITISKKPSDITGEVNNDDSLKLSK
jgi:ribonuclease HI